ncbi:DUF927 domain-containing protein [Thiohalobacter thiocyanaticus]|uniref:DUF927 domain-containing protein n=1 Tax=Thiohalobacter thiocyanaticus TaxID=585455 RepID=A0A426QL86_9GAMM|nr:DUF927 domain-containing protein [Thiohalobacter thiocyanaticus]RRQ22446.1 DUF927 domain-containing protein [Thiohalobacter thiocyanaticus]
MSMQNPLPDRIEHTEGHPHLTTVLPPWAGLAVPDGFTLTETGVYQSTTKGDYLISGPIWVDALTRDNHNGSWGLSIRWWDCDKQMHCRAISRPRLHEPGSALAQELACEGLHIVPGKERELNRYLSAFVPEARLRSVTRLGWVDHPEDALVYLLPGDVVTVQGKETLVYQPERHSPSTHTLHPKGSLEAWQDQVAAPCEGNPLLTFAITVALAAPLLKAAHQDGGGFHLYGGSSRGKTTALQVAASVWGCGADPAEAASQTSIHRWNATRNGLEGLAAAHNDGLLALDELGSLDAEDFGRVIYDLAGGQGKAAMNANRTLKEQHTWRNLILSTGEISGQQKIQENRRQTKAGQQLRFMDIPITGGIIEETRGLEPAEFANRLKRACGQYYGTAGPAFLHAIVQRFHTSAHLQQAITEQVDRETGRLAEGVSAPEHRRAIHKLALVLDAGEMAQKYGVLPHLLDIRQSIETVRDAWLADSNNRPSTILGARAVKGFIQKHRERFRDALTYGGPPSPHRDICGYYNGQADLYIFTDEGFAEACGGHNAQVVASELSSRGLLHMNDGRYKSKHVIMQDGQKRRSRYYAVKGHIYDEEFD